MKIKNLKFCVLMLFTLAFNILNAQESTNTSGGDASGSGGSVSYSVGQSFYITSFGENGSIAEGVQQPYEISEVTGVEFGFIKLSFSAYPNPVSNSLTLSIDSLNYNDLNYSLFDLKGNIIRHENIISNLTSIDMSSITSSIYFLKISGKNIEIKTFKIVRR